MRRIWPAVLALSILAVGTDALAAPKHAPKRSHPAELKLKPSSAPEPDASAGASNAAPAPTRGPTRLDFDDRLIQGQTNRSGAVYLYDRKELKTRSMVKKRESFRDEIITSVFDT